MNGTGQDGTASRNILDAPGFRSVDLAIFRDFKIRERYGLQVRAEATNAFNMVSLKTPSASGPPHNPGGCLFVQGALACGESADPVRQELISRRAAGEVAIRRRLRRAKSEGDLPADSDPVDLARFIATVAQGMPVQAAGGASRSDLQRVIQTALRAWPE